MTFRANTDQYTTANPIMKAALVILAHSWPRVITVQALFEQAYEQLQAAQVVLAAPKPQLLEQLAFDLLRAFCQSVYLVRFHSCPPQVATEVSSHPVASALARRQAQTQSIVTTLYHESVVLDPPLLRLLPLVDGTRDRAALERDYEAHVGSGDEAADHAADDIEAVPNIDQLVRQLLWRGLLVE
jgi:methyltransferase-like protein